MNQDFSELIQYLDRKFQDTAKKKDLEELSTKLVGYEEFDKRVDGLEKSFEELKESFNKLQSSVDAYAKKANTYFQEMVMLSHKVDRHEKWIKQIAEKLGVKLKY